MADIAMVIGFSHADLCRMELDELARWHDRAHRINEAMKERAGQ